MSNRPCILAAVDLDGRAGPVIDHAARLAALSRADLLVIHVVDYHAGFESDHFPAQSPARVRQAMIEHARASLVGYMTSLGIDAQRQRLCTEPNHIRQGRYKGAAFVLEEFGTAIGIPPSMVRLSARHQTKYLRGIRTARRMFVAKQAAWGWMSELRLQVTLEQGLQTSW